MTLKDIECYTQEPQGKEVTSSDETGNNSSESSSINKFTVDSLICYPEKISPVAPSEEDLSNAEDDEELEEDEEEDVSDVEESRDSCQSTNEQTDQPNARGYSTLYRTTDDPINPYGCQFCQKMFTRLSYLKRHEQVHSDAMPYQCEFCQRFFKHKRSRDRHVRLHTGDKRYACTVCSACFSRSDHLKIHLKTHNSNKPFQCLLCNRGYTTMAALTAHTQTHHGRRPAATGGVNQLRCLQCTATYPSPGELQRHIRTAHPPLACPILSHSNSPHFPSVISAHQSLLQCPACHKAGFATLGLLHNHLLQSQSHFLHCPPYTCPLCRALSGSVRHYIDHLQSAHLPQTPLKSPLLLSMSDEITCALCSKNFSSEQDVKNHVEQVHCPPNAVVSPTAKASSPKSSLLSFGMDNIIQKSDSDSSGYSCSQCNTNFLSLTEFQTHLNQHIDMFLKKFPCPECGLQLASEPARQSHFLSHFSDISTEYGCYKCEKCFSQLDGLHNHLLEAHTNLLFKCSLCHEMFDNKVGIQVHFSVKHRVERRQYRCKKCNASFNQELDFEMHIARDHLQIIEGNNTFNNNGRKQCIFCGKAFPTDEELQQHYYTHMKHFSCIYCEKVFHLSSLLEQHIKANHLSQLLSKNETEDSSDSSSPSAKKSRLSESPVDQENTVSESSSCEICSSTFHTQADMLRHKTNHAFMLNIPRCTLCNAVFGSPSNLAAHMFEHKVINVGNLCSFCNTPLTSEDIFFEHFDKHVLQKCLGAGASRDASMKYIECIICKQPLTSAAELHTHAKFHTHIDLTARGYRCSVCYQTFQTKTNLYCKVDGNGCPFYICGECKKSLQNHFPVDPATKDQPNSTAYKPPVSNSVGIHSSKTFYCPQCPMVFATIAELVNHSGVHLMPRAPNSKTYQCIKCQKVFSTEKDIQDHVTAHVLEEGVKHECRLCQKVFDSPARLQCHLIEHSYTNKDFICPVCHLVIKTSRDLQSHVLSHSDAVKPHKCQVCSQCFFFTGELEQHMSYHSSTLLSPKIDRLQCPICLRSFTSEINLKNHMKIHMTKNQSLKCSLCTDIFTNPIELQLHFFKVHKSSMYGEQKQSFNCVECGMEFPCLSNLQGHLRIHGDGKKYPCEVCGKVFGVSKNLTIHMRCHSGVRPYECPICTRRFTRKENRKVHLKSHSGLKPYLCPHCGKLFSRKSHVKEHLKLHDSSSSNHMIACSLCSNFTCESIQLLHAHFACEHSEIGFTTDVEELSAETPDSTTSNVCQETPSSSADMEEDDLVDVE